MSQNQLTAKNIMKYVEKIIGESFHQKRVESKANAAIGVIKAVDLKVQSIGHGLASMLDKESKHAIKQIDQYLSNEGIDLEEFFECWVKYQIRILKEILVAMDWTDFETDKQTTLTIHQISRHSRAMPLLWKSVEKENLKNKRNEYEDEMLNQLKKNLPFTIEEGYRDFKDDRFGLGLSNTSIKSSSRRDRLLIAAAIANVLLTILGAAGEDLGYDRLLKSNTSKARTHSLFRQGVLYFDKLSNMRPERKDPLLFRFAELLSMHQLFAFQLCLA